MTDFSTLRLPLESDAWYDADERMFQACFAILRQFVEDELGPDEDGDGYRGFRLDSCDIEENDPSGAPPRRSSDKDAIDLWLWYRDELPKIEDAYTAEVHRCFSDAWSIKPTGELVIQPKGEMMFPYDYPEIVKDEKLKELIELRRCLWT